MPHTHFERHNTDRIGWLRAAVLGANDGIVSTASLIMGVAAASAGRGDVLVAGVAGLVAGAMSMAAGEFVSVSSQSDAERADLARERKELAEEPAMELQELTNIYIGRGVEPALALQVAEQMTAKDALAAHARDELGLSSITQARPIQAAIASAAAFATGAALPLAVVVALPFEMLASAVPISSLLFLTVLGFWSARTSGVRSWKPVVRVVGWGAFAMAVTAAIGALFGAVV
ncbi:MAG: VIT family protein [Hyphomonadaceae bacterium]|jgi:VIT1/CCC1 family predicted Fe2+/Mn2+ transporter|nr:VIT family protein [Hyphomonadaceae bacterium]